MGSGGVGRAIIRAGLKYANRRRRGEKQRIWMCKGGKRINKVENVEKQRVVLSSCHLIRLLKTMSSNGERHFSPVSSSV